MARRLDGYRTSPMGDVIVMSDNTAERGVQETAERLRQLAMGTANWLSDDDLRTLAFAAYQLEHLHKHLGMERSFKKMAQFFASEKDEQLDQAHAILGSEAMIHLVNGTDEPRIVGPIHEYWSKYGNVYGEAPPFK